MIAQTKRAFTQKIEHMSFLIVMYCENDYRVTLWSRMANGNVCDYERGDKK